MYNAEENQVSLNIITPIHQRKRRRWLAESNTVEINQKEPLRDEVQANERRKI